MAESLAMRCVERDGLDLDSAKSVAILALSVAAQEFDPERGVPFSRFGRATVRRALVGVGRSVRGE